MNASLGGRLAIAADCFSHERTRKSRIKQPSVAFLQRTNDVLNLTPGEGGPPDRNVPTTGAGAIKIDHVYFGTSGVSVRCKVPVLRLKYRTKYK